MGIALQAIVSATAADSGAADLRQLSTTGSIASGSNQLDVKSATGFRLGDWVIVEIGSEAGRGQRGTRGVGGTWPSKSYSTEAQLLADRGQPNRLFAWAEDTGYVFWWLDGRWLNMAPNRPNMFYTGYYYLGKAVPRSLQARITAISQNTLTLDKPAAAAASGANVYLDTAPIISNMIAAGASLSLPAGHYPAGGVIWIKDKTRYLMSGQGKDQTRIYSPRGVAPATIHAYNSPGTVIRDLTLQGNFGDQGFGLNWTGSTPPEPGQAVTESNVPQGGAWPRGIFVNVGSHNSVVQDVRVIDVSQGAVSVSRADNVWARRVENVQNDVMRQYVAWQLQWADTSGGGCEDCEVRSTYIIPGFNLFKANRVSFVRPKGRNAIMAVNVAGGWLIEGADLRFTAKSLHPDGYVTPFHPIIDVNTNAGKNAQVTLGGTIRSVTMVQEGYLNAKNDSLRGIVVNEHNPDIHVDGAAYYAPDYRAPSVLNGAVGLNSTGLNTRVDGMLVIGKPKPGQANLFIQRGTGQNCSALVVSGCSTAIIPGRP
jgi:hypothetical protein